jgi:hypothetical protein
MTNNEELGGRLLKLKGAIEKKKSERSELQGELKSITKQLKDEFGVATVEEAKKLQEKKETERTELQGDIAVAIEEIEELMGVGNG